MPTSSNPSACLSKACGIKSLQHRDAWVPWGLVRGQQTPPHPPPPYPSLTPGALGRRQRGTFSVPRTCFPLLGLCLCLGMCLFWKRNLSPQTSERLGSCRSQLSHHFLREVFAGFQKVSPLRCSQHCSSCLLAAPTPPLSWNFSFVRVRPREVLETPVSPVRRPHNPR